MRELDALDETAGTDRALEHTWWFEWPRPVWATLPSRSPSAPIATSCPVSSRRPATARRAPWVQPPVLLCPTTTEPHRDPALHRKTPGSPRRQA
jgi:hypothetical protein